MATGYTEASGTLTNQAVAVFAANAGRRGLILGNPSDTVMTVRFSSSDASATVGVPLPAGTALEWRDPRSCPDGRVSLFCAGTSKAYTAYEW